MTIFSNNNNNNNNIEGGGEYENININDDGHNSINEKLINKNNNINKKDLVLLNLFFIIFVMSIYLYSLFIPNLFLEYVSNNFKLLPINLQQAKATYYKTISDAFPFLSLFLFRPILNLISNKFGRKKILYFGIILLLIDVLSCWISIKTQNLIYYYIFHSIFGCFNIVGLNNNLISNLIFLYIDDIIINHNGKHKSILYLISSSSFCIGVIIGPIIYIFTMLSKDLSFTLYIIAGLLLICLIIIPFLNECKTIDNGDGGIDTINPFKIILNLFKSNIAIYLKFVIILYFSILYTGQDSISTYYYYCSLMYNWGAKEHGLFVSSLGFVMLFWSLIFVPCLLKLISSRKLITIGLLISLFGHCFFIFSTVLEYGPYFYLIGGAFSTFVPSNILLILNLILNYSSKLNNNNINKSNLISSIQSIGSLAMFLGSFASNDIFRYSISTFKYFLPQLIYFINGVIVFITLITSIILWLIFKK